MSEARAQRNRVTRLRTVLCAGWVASQMLLATGARAASPEEKAAADALFDDGLALLKAGSLDAACKKLEQSQRIDPAIGTLFYLGDCYEKSGKTASAWTTFREAAAAARAAGQMDRVRVGEQRADKLATQLSKLTVQVAPDNGSIDGLEVKKDALVVTRGLWGTPLPVDPGEHTLVASAPGYEAVEVKVMLGPNGQNQTVEIPVLKRLPEGAAVTPSGSTEPASSPSSGATTAPADGPRADGSGQRTAGIVTAAAGIVGLGLGGIFGALTLSDNDKAKAGNCSPSNCANPTEQGADAARSAQQNATISTIGFIAGGALVAAGAVIYFTAPDATETAELHVEPTYGGAALSFGGTF